MAIKHPENAIALLKLMQLCSPSLPVGGYAYSQGLETAVHQARVDSMQATEDWLSVQLVYGLARLDLPVMQRLFIAFEQLNDASFMRWNHYLLAARETQELLNADCEMAKALFRLMTSLNVGSPFKSALPRYKRDDMTTHLSFTSVFSVLAYQWGIRLEDAQTGFCWSWLENQVAAATKLVPLGQTQAQQLICLIQTRIPEAIAQSATLEDDFIGGSLPALAIASAQHEQQYSRLFRS